MSEKATFASVTKEACTCGHLRLQALDPDIPVEFDDALGEYRLLGRQPGSYSVIYHCHFCGGVAPASQRASQFAFVTTEESRRLATLVQGLRTVEEAIARFGAPTEEKALGLARTTPETADRPEQTTWYRTLTFCNLSETADVLLVDRTPDPVSFSFQGKYLGVDGRAV